jgi:hypothetical protein
MAEDLGTLNIKVGADKDSFNQAGKEASKGAGGAVGGMGDMIRGVSRGGVSGGAQAGARLAGLLKLAAVIGVAVAGLVLFKVAINKVIKTVTDLANTVQNTIKTMASINAIASASSARSQIKELTRNIKSAGVLSKPFANTSAKWEDMLDAVRPLKDILSLLKGILLEMLIPVIRWAVDIMKSLAISILQWLITKLDQGRPDPNWLSILSSGGPLGFLSNLIGINPFGPPIVYVEDSQFEAYAEALRKILKALKDGNDKDDEIEINRYMGQVGISLTGGAWNPWGNP